MTWSRRFRRRPQFECALVAAAAVFAITFMAPGCGTGVNEQDVRLDVAFDRTGSLQSDGFYFPMSVNNNVSFGDSGSNFAERGIVSVTLGAIPAGAKVTNVVLTLMREAPFGNPYEDFGALTVDHVNVVAGIGAAEFSGSTLAATIATIPSGPVSQVVELDVTAYVKADIAAGRPISSFRFQFAGAPSADNAADRAYFSANPDNVNLQPFATATFQP